MARPRSLNPICEVVPALDVRRLHREGKLLFGRTSNIAWAHDGEPEPCSSIRLEAGSNAIVLSFRTVESGHASPCANPSC
jgi:hypothetical protein